VPVFEARIVLRARVFRAVALACLVATSTAAHAEAPPRAEELFQQANALALQGRYVEACPKLEESQRIEPAVGTQFNLADCYEHLGRTATAYALFVEVGRIARAAGKFERERVARERAGALEPKLARVRLVLAAEPPGLEIKIDDVEIPRTQWSSAFPVDPGERRVVAGAPSRKTWQGRVSARSGATADLAIPDLADVAPKPMAPPPPTGRTQKILATSAAGLALGGLVVGTVAGIASLSSRSSAEEACPSDVYAFRCPTEQGASDWNAATTAGNVATIGFVVAGVALAAAAALWLTAPTAPKSRAATSGAEQRF
jgi:hypothetical protein